jgi:hypothetical protein
MKFEASYELVKQDLLKGTCGKGAYDEPVISKETLQRIMMDHFGSDPRTVRQHINALVLKGKLKPYPSGKVFALLDDGRDTPEDVMIKLEKMRDAGMKESTASSGVKT